MEIHIKISVHITDSNFERIIRTSDHPWKLQFKSTLIFQSVFVLPLKGINTSLRTLQSSNGWLSSKSVLSHQPYMLTVQALVQLNREEFRETGSKEGRWEQPLVKGHVHTSCKITHLDR